MNRRGFSIVEIMGIMAIVGTLCAISYPKILIVQMTNRETMAISYMRTMMQGFELFRNEHTRYATGTQYKANYFYNGINTGYLPPNFYMDCNDTTNAAVPPGYTGGLLPNGYVCKYLGDAGVGYNEGYVAKLRPKTKDTGRRVFVFSNLFEMRHCLGLDTNINNLKITGPAMATLDQQPMPCPA